MSADLFVTTRTVNYGTGQTVTYTGTAGVVSNGLPEGCPAVVVWTTTAAYVKVGVSPTATTADLPIPANVPVVLPVQVATGGGAGAGLIKVSAVQIASGGSLFICALTA